jgi:hypothetical protein
LIRDKQAKDFEYEAKLKYYDEQILLYNERYEKE